MPKTKLQEVVFTILMVFVMVYAMICYNIALNMGGMSNIVFLNAFHELVIMGPIAFILDFFLYGSLSKTCIQLSVLSLIGLAVDQFIFTRLTVDNKCLQ